MGSSSFGFRFREEPEIRGALLESIISLVTKKFAPRFEFALERCSLISRNFKAFAATSGKPDLALTTNGPLADAAICDFYIISYSSIARKLGG